MPSRPTGGNLQLPDGKPLCLCRPFQMDLPAGTVNVEAVHGFEYKENDTIPATLLHRKPCLGFIGKLFKSG